jgi:hypothetical protein
MNGCFVYPPLKSKPLTCARRPPYESSKTRLCNGLSPIELFAPTGIQTLDLMGFHEVQGIHHTIFLLIEIVRNPRNHPPLYVFFRVIERISKYISYYYIC